MYEVLCRDHSICQIQREREEQEQQLEEEQQIEEPAEYEQEQEAEEQQYEQEPARYEEEEAHYEQEEPQYEGEPPEAAPYEEQEFGQEEEAPQEYNNDAGDYEADVSFLMLCMYIHMYIAVLQAIDNEDTGSGSGRRARAIYDYQAGTCSYITMYVLEV